MGESVKSKWQCLINTLKTFFQKYPVSTKFYDFNTHKFLIKTRKNLFYKNAYKYLLSCFPFQLYLLKYLKQKLVFKIYFKESTIKGINGYEQRHFTEICVKPNFRD